MRKVPAVNSPAFWDNLYRQGSDAWDTGAPTPAFLDLMNGGDLQPGTALVLGCGKGQDAVSFAEHRFAVTAVDFSGEALQRARSLARDKGVQARFLHADLFGLPPDQEGAYDYVIEYVTYCAIDPLRRRDFVNVVANALKPGGRFVALLFPIDSRPGGPPFAVPVRETLRLFSDRLDLISLEFPERSVAPRRGKEVMTIWLKR